MNRIAVFSTLSLAALACGSIACSLKSPEGASAPSGSEVAVSVASGAVYATPPKKSAVDRALDALNPIGTAYAASWSCSGDGLTPTFAGPGQYAFTPASCSVTWGDGHTATSSWSGPFQLVYGSSCDATHPFMENQAAGCAVTRTTASGPVTRSITGPDGFEYAISHDTNGAGTGWDSSVSPAPSDGGVQITCGSDGCSAARTLVINGSHLTGTVAIGRDSDKIWDHTVSTGEGGLTVTGEGPGRVVNGTVIVQHNIIHVTSTTTFNGVQYTEPGCCFPTGGTATTTFSQGPDVGKSETLSFSEACGEATLTRTDGRSEALTLQHCL